MLIEDTDPLLTTVWQSFLTGGDLTDLPSDKADLYLLLDTDIPWRDDGTRYQGDPSARAASQSCCLQALERAASRYILVSGSVETRWITCRDAVSAMLAASP